MKLMNIHLKNNELKVKIKEFYRERVRLLIQETTNQMITHKFKVYNLNSKNLFQIIFKIFITKLRMNNIHKFRVKIL